MPQAIRVGLIGGGWPGGKHAEGYKAAGGFELAAVADLIPGRRKKLIETFGNLREYSDAMELLKDAIRAGYSGRLEDDDRLQALRKDPDFRTLARAVQLLRQP